MPGTDTNIASLYTGSPPRQQQPPSPTSPVLRDEREIDPVQDGALQFVPAFTKADAKDHSRNTSSSRSRRRSHEQTSWEGASWDALLAEEEKKESSDVAVPRARSAISAPNYQRNHPTNSSTGRRSPFLRNGGGSKYTTADVSSGSSHNKQPTSPGNRMARIKSIFHHRARAASEAGAANNNSFSMETPTQHTAAAPPSPAHSGSGSSAYVGWPGTQDKAGKVIATVATSSSYEDSSTAGPPVGQHQHPHDVHNTLSKEGSRTQDTSRWTAQTSACTEDGDDDDLSTAGGFPSPIRQSNLDQSSFSSFPDDPADPFHPQSAAEFHLAAAVADAKAAARGADRDRSTVPNTTTRRSSESDILSRAIPLTRTKVSLSHSAALSQQSHKRGQSPTVTSAVVVGDQNVSPKPNLLFSSDPFAEWDAAESPALSKSSSAYFNAREVSKMHLGYPDFSPSPSTRNSKDPVGLDDDAPSSPGDDDSPQDGFTPAARQRSPAYAPYNSRHQKDAAAAAASALRRRQQQPERPRSQPPTEDALQQLSSPPHFNFATPTSKGFRGLLDKTKEVPSLMDNLDSDASLSSSKATSVSGAQSNSGGKGGVGGVSRSHREFLRNMYDIDADAQTVSDVFDGISVSKESDVFDNLSLGDRSSPRNKLFTAGQQRHRAAYPERIAEEDDTNLNSSRDSNNQNEGFNLVALGGGLTAIQTTEEDFQRRQTASDYDDCNLTNSDVSSNGYAKIPGYHQMLSAGKGEDSSLRGIHGNLGANRGKRGATVTQQQRSAAGSAKQPHFGSWPPQPQQESSSDFRSSGSSSSSESEFSLFSDPYQSDSGLDVEGDLSEFYIHPSLMKKVLRKYRKFSEQDTSALGLADFERCEDERKVFALFEMRSRIMEKDIERGLERRGGTSVVDDLVLTPYNRTAHRVRDAVIVSKAWRDGATISDVINSALLTRRAEHSFFIRRPVVRPNERAGRYSHSVQRYTWEARKWVDDADFMQYRCPSLGSRHMWGFELFTIGDCQSMLLKLTNERCLVRKI